MLKKLKILVYSNILVSQILFFSLFAALGLTYQGSGESSIYSLYLVISSFTAYLLFFWELFQRGTFKSVLVTIFTVPLVMLFFIFLAPEHTFVKNQTKLFFVLVMPASLIGYSVARGNLINFINKGFIFSSVIVLLGVLRTIPRLFSSSVIDLMDVFGGGQYQAFSYFCSFSFLTIFNSYLNKSYLKWREIFIYLSSLIVFVSGVILSGGRGGLVVIVVGIVIFVIHKKGFFYFIKYFLLVLLSILFLIRIFDYLDIPFADRIIESFDRLFSFISSDGINMEGTSNRDSFYTVAIDKISQSLIFGYGIFGLVSLLGDFYPHNIFLEILLQGGIIYLFSFFLVMVLFFVKLVRLIKYKKDEAIILIPVVYSFVMLLFSSSYIQEPFFWFSISYVFSFPFYKFKK